MRKMPYDCEEEQVGIVETGYLKTTFALTQPSD